MNHALRPFAHRSHAGGRPTLHDINWLALALTTFAACVGSWALHVGVGEAATKQVVRGLTIPAAGGVPINTPRGVAVNRTGVGGAAVGETYVVDRNNNRVATFSATGAFVRVFGLNVGGTGVHVCSTACSAGTASALAGGMSLPQGVAVSPLTGNVFVTDNTSKRVDVFTAAGVFVRAFGLGVGGVGVSTCTTTCQAGTSGSGAGQFAANIGSPGVDPITGNVFVADVTGRRVQQWTPAGAFVSAFGFDVVSAGPGNTAGATYEICVPANGDTCKVGVANATASPAAPAGQFGTAGATEVAVSSLGTLYVTDPTNRRIQKFGPTLTAGGAYVTATVSGTSTSNAPSDVAVDPTNDDVYVVKPAVASPFERQVLQFDASETLRDTHGVGGGLPAMGGVAVNGTTGDIFVSPTTGQEVLALNAPVDPTATIGPATGIAAHGATFNGVVNPRGYATNYHFEYSADSDTWTAAGGDLSAGAGTAEVAVTPQSVSGLLANVTYRVRLVARKVYNPTPAISAAAEFDTAPAPPDVGPVATDPILAGSTAVRVSARVDPHYSTATFRFEYGPTTAYGARAPLTDGRVRGGGSPVTTSVNLEDLEPGETYHVRAIVTNGAGETVGPDRTFTIPDGPRANGRGSELVTPAGSQAYDVTPQSLATRPATAAGARASTSDGNSVAWEVSVNGTLPGMSSDGDVTDPVVSTRGASGWAWKAPLGDRTACAGGSSLSGYDLAADASRVLFGIGCVGDKAALSPQTTTGEVLDQTSGLGSISLYTGALSTDEASYVTGRFDGDGPAVRNDSGANVYVGGSPDLSTVYFTASNAALVPDAPAVGLGLYRHTDSGSSLLARKFDGTPFVGATGVDRPGAVSTSGEAITFQAPGSGTAGSNGNMVAGDTNTVDDVYQVRGNGATWATQTEYTGGVAQTPVARAFAGASSNGARIFFTTTEKMVGNGASNGDLDTASDIYMYDASQPTGSRLSLVSAADPDCAVTAPNPCNANTSNTAAGNATNTSTAKFVARSDDGSHVFFITGDILDPDDTDAQQSLYVRDVVAGQTTYIAPAGLSATNATSGVDAGTSSTASLASSRVKIRPIKVSESGNVAAFLLGTNVTLSPERGGDDQDGTRDLYVWSEVTGLRRARQGPEPTDNTTNVPSVGCIVAGDLDTGTPSPSCRGISVSGDLVFFQTPDALSSADTNASLDVYAIRPATGDVDLISGGDDSGDSLFFDNDATGSNVFFATGETLDPSRDTDGGHFDVYDARLGEVFPPAPPEPAPCNAVEDGCQAPPSVWAPLPGPGAGSDEGPVGARVPTFSVSAVSTATRRSLALTGKLRLAVRLSDGGTVLAVATSEVGKRQVRVGRATRTLSAGGSTTLVVALSRAARSELTKRGKLTLKLVVTYSKAAVAQTASLKLTRPAKNAAKAKKQTARSSARASRGGRS